MNGIRTPGLRAAALAIALALSGGATAQVVGYDIRTGDVWVDTRLGEINDYGYRYRDPFIDEMHDYYGAPRPLLVELLDRRRWAPADVYYACALAHALRLPCIDIVREYDRHPGKGWGAVAKRYGIKPGSPAFHALKRGTVATYDHWGHPIVIDRPVRVDWSKHGPKRSKGRGFDDNEHYADEHGSHGDKGRGQGNGKDKGKHKDKGRK